MSFTSVNFFIFLAIIILLYWDVPIRLRNPLLLLASLVFYISHSLHGLAIIGVMVVGTFFSARAVSRSRGNERKRYIFFLGGLTLNLSILFYYKYLNFFVSQLGQVYSFQFKEWDFLIPIGLSFCTFQSMSYLIDVFKGKKDEDNFFLFAQYVIFFPLVLAGPIERSHKLISQFSSQLSPEIAKGLPLIALGLFKKLVVADNLRLITGSFLSSENPFEHASSLTIIMIGYAISFQYYFDFSAYSEIARGIGFLFGINLSVNFRFPFTSLSPRKFWKAWHITLGHWFRDYVHLPLMRYSIFKNDSTIVTLITFTLIGIWHGASWNFVIFGVSQGLWYLIFEKSSQLFRRRMPFFIRIISSILFMNIIYFSSGLIFSIPSVSGLWSAFIYLFSTSFVWSSLESDLVRTLCFYIVPVSLFEIYMLYRKCTSISEFQIWQQVVFYTVLIYVTVTFGNFSVKEFLYFNF
jgi:alginate O-acetyltransferase complex protein AlgI